MTTGERHRVVAWAREPREVRERLREALRVTRTSLDEATEAEPARDLLVFCRGFCAALTGHHHGEDQVLFPAIRAAARLRD